MSLEIKKYLNLNNIVLIAALVLAGSWAIGSINTLNHNYDLQRQVDQARLDNQLIELQNQNLRLEQAFFQTDEFLDLQARSLLGKATPGERLVLLPKTTKSSPQNNNRIATETAAKSNLNQWLDFLFGRRE